MPLMRATVESNPEELFRVEEWSPPKGTGTASWAAIVAGSSLGPFISGFSGLSLDVEFSLLVLFMVCAFAALSLQILILRRGGASTRIQWFDSNILRVFGPIEIEVSKVEREHFAAAGMVPTALFLLLLVGSLAVVPEEASGFVLTTLLGAALGGSIKELAYSVLALKRPRGTLVEELEGGAVRFYKPTFPRL